MKFFSILFTFFFSVQLLALSPNMVLKKEIAEGWNCGVKLCLCELSAKQKFLKTGIYESGTFSAVLKTIPSFQTQESTPSTDLRTLKHLKTSLTSPLHFEDPRSFSYNSHQENIPSLLMLDKRSSPPPERLHT